jgi:phospholipase D1/2
MSLWAEHLDMLDETFKEPERLECVRKVNEVANNNWRIYSSEDMSQNMSLQGHLLKYPVQIDSDGQISSLPDCENFPDAGGKILGAHSATIPDILTT